MKTAESRGATRHHQSKLLHRIVVCLGAMGVTILVMLLLMAVYDVEPFGDCSLAAADCKIQYLDFFNYYKDILRGQNSAEYTLTKGLGGNAIGLFSYYLASPLNLLMLLFDGAQANTVVDILIVVKLGLSAATLAYFLQARLHDRISSLITILLSAGYGLSYYSFKNGSNLMWLDGMFMLPLMLLGTYRVVRRRSLAPLAVPTALSIIANWYTGGINCLFCIIWLVFEFFMQEIDPEEPVAGVMRREVQASGDRGEVERRGSASGVWGEGKQGAVGVAMRLIGAVLRYGAAMLLGIFISAAIFFPTVAVMQQGRGSSFYPTSNIRNAFIGNILSVISQYRIGGTSDLEHVCLYCGSLAMIGTIAFFLTRKIRLRRKIIVGGLLAVTVLIYYWQPLYFAFSLFKKVDSYYSRYGYIGCLVLAFIAAMYMERACAYAGAGAAHYEGAGAAHYEGAGEGHYEGGAVECALPFISSVIFCVLLLKVGDHPTLAVEGVKETCFFMLGAGVCITIILIARAIDAGIADEKSGKLAVRNGSRTAHARKAGERRWGGVLAGMAATILLLVTIGELYQSGLYVLSYKRYRGVKQYAAYVRDARKQAEELKEYDGGTYRISQIGWRDLNAEKGLTAVYNDALAYNYMGIGGYTSSPNNDEMYFLDRLGYKEENLCMNIVNTSFVPADSMLGVRYVFSNVDVPGMEKVDGLGTYNGRETYMNPYALPIAFVYGGDMLPKHEYHEPFEYLEEIWTALAGEKANIFTPLDSVKTVSGNTISWDLKIPDGNVCLYGDLPTKQSAAAMLTAGTAAPTGYSQWLAPEIFTIPYEERGSGGVGGRGESDSDSASGGSDSGSESDGSDESVTVTVTSEKVFEPEYELFYALNLDRLKELSDKIRKGADQITDFSLENGSMRCTVTAHEGEKLFLILPRTVGWQTTLNGQNIETEVFAYCLTVIPLVEGENRIERVYRAPYLRRGILISVAGVLLLAAYEVAGGRRIKGKSA